jgi:hypothetical protein
MGYVIENLRDRDIREVWGEPGGKVREELIISRLSGRSLKDFRDTVSGIEALYWGTDEVPGLAAYGAQKGFDFDEDFSKLTGRVLNSFRER